MKDCSGCIHESSTLDTWSSTQPHPCTNCSRICYDPIDKYQPKPTQAGLRTPDITPPEPKECVKSYPHGSARQINDDGTEICMWCREPINPDPKPKVDELGNIDMYPCTKERRMWDKINEICHIINQGGGR